MAYQMLMGILNLEDSSPSNWVWSDTVTSTPSNCDVSVLDSNIQDSDDAKQSLENSYPVANQTIGDVGCVDDNNGTYYIFEAQ